MRSLTLLALGAVLLTACSSDSTTTTVPTTTDSTGRYV